MSNPTTFQHIGNIPVPEDGIFALHDPAYTEEDVELGAVVWVDWSMSEAPVYLAVDTHGNRALVVTSGSLPPAELLQAELKGAYVIQEHLGVDSGQVGIYTSDEKPLLKDVPPTYLGDGIFPVAMWGKDGAVVAFAVLTDRAYYDPNWSAGG